MAVATRDRILNRARVVLAMGGRPTVADFAQAAGVSRASFYRSFRSREDLLAALQRSPEPGAADRILEAAMSMVGEHGLAALSMDELADRAEVSRATLYRIFPGKAALFSALMHAFSPLDPVIDLLAARRDSDPETVMPEIARTVYRSVCAGDGSRTGMLRALFFEVTSLSPDAEDATREGVLKVVGAMASYITEQMSSGRLRRMHPVLALQSFIGPIFFHALTRRAAEQVLHIDVDGEEAVTELAQAWLRAMKAEEANG
ncbi:MAG TPA: helix-turn-helix domain-containing protein [Candidatus Udaeobacter sp.]|nr:helix-turn-helix domain-containing protein [Candidatus Udaeobacter sp.]